MAEEEQVDDLLRADSADMTTLEPEPMQEVESASPAKPVTAVKPTSVKKTVRSTSGGETAPKRVPIPAPPSSAKEPKDVAQASKPKSAFVPRVPKKGTRFFIMKSVNGPNLEYSMENGVWATQRHNEEKLQDAFAKGGPVFLIFSLVGSGNFQGYARMTSGFLKGQGHQWPGAIAVGDICHIKWERIADIGFRELENVTNPLNEDKPLKMCRDGQELPANIGEMLIKMFHEREEQPLGRHMQAGGAPRGERHGFRDRDHDRGFGGGRGGHAGHGGRQPFRNSMQRNRPQMNMGMPMGGPMMMMGQGMGGPPMNMPGGPIDLGMNPMDFLMGGAGPPDLMGRPAGAGGFLGGNLGPGPQGFGGRGMSNGFMGDAGPLMRFDRDSLGPRGAMGSLGGRGMPRPPPQPMRDFSVGGGGLFGVGNGQFAGPKPPPVTGGIAARLGPSRLPAEGAMGNIGMGMGRMSMEVDDEPHYREYRSRRDDRSRRERSLSGSPRHSRSRRRSRSRSRSRDRKDITNMSYEEYVEVFKKVQENAARINPGVNQMGMMGMNGMMGQPMMGAGMMGQGMMSGMGMGMGGGMGGGGMGSNLGMAGGMGGGVGSNMGMGGGGFGAMHGAMNGGSAMGMGMHGGGGMGGGTGGGGGGGGGGGSISPANLTEEGYLQIWREYSRKTGEPFEADKVRGWYRQFKANM